MTSILSRGWPLWTWLLATAALISGSGYATSRVFTHSDYWEYQPTKPLVRHQSLEFCHYRKDESDFSSNPNSSSLCGHGGDDKPMGGVKGLINENTTTNPVAFCRNPYFLLNVGDGDTQLLLLPGDPEDPGDGRLQVNRSRREGDVYSPDPFAEPRARSLWLNGMVAVACWRLAPANGSHSPRSAC